MAKILSWWMILASHVIQLVFDEYVNFAYPSIVVYITFGLSVILNFFIHFVFSQDSLVNVDTCHNFLTHWFYIYIFLFYN